MTFEDLQAEYDVVVIGAGPAGLSAATVTAKAGLSTLLVDENPGPGGQVYRAVMTTPVRDRSLLGKDYWHGADIVAAAEASDVQWLTGTTVWSLDRDLIVGLSRDGEARMISARRVIIATGAMERPMPIPGWTLPGVMTAGGAQTILKAAGLLPSGKTVLAGTGPLLWLLAAQLLRAGCRIEAMLDTTPPRAWLAAAPHAIGFLLSPLFRKGLALRSEVSRKVRIVSGVTELRAAGEGQLRTVTYTAGGTSRMLDADTLLLHQGVVPNTNLAMAAGVAHEWDELQACWVPRLDAWGESSVSGLAIAGDGAGIAGAWAAEERGRLAGIAAVRKLAPYALVEDDQPVRQRLARHLMGRTFLDTMFRPIDAMRVPADDSTVVCRCEEVTAGEVRAAARLGCEGPNQLKAFTRCGMGPCQGRLCGLTVTELLAEANGASPQAVGHYRIRSPVKPISLAEIAAMPSSPSAVKAVVR